MEPWWCKRILCLLVSLEDLLCCLRQIWCSIFRRIGFVLCPYIQSSEVLVKYCQHLRERSYTYVDKLSTKHVTDLVQVSHKVIRKVF